MLVRFLVVAAVAGAAMTGCGRYGFGSDGDPDGSTIDPTASCDDIPGVLVCSGFEEDTGYWTLESEQQATTTTLCPSPHAGERCLVARSEQGGSAGRAFRGHTPLGSGTIYARAYAHIEAGVAIAGINIFALDAANSGVYGVDLNVVSGDQFEVYLEEAPQTSNVSSGPVPLGQWFCLHAAVTIDDTAGSVTAGYEGTSIDFQGIDTYPNGAYDYVAVGLDWTHDQQGPITVMIDDVVVATSPLPCP